MSYSVVQEIWGRIRNTSKLVVLVVGLAIGLAIGVGVTWYAFQDDFNNNEQDADDLETCKLDRARFDLISKASGPPLVPKMNLICMTEKICHHFGPRDRATHQDLGKLLRRADSALAPDWSFTARCDGPSRDFGQTFLGQDCYGYWKRKDDPSLSPY